MKTYIIPTAFALAVITPLCTQAQNTLISGDIGTAANWDDNVLPTDSLNPGVIDASNTGANQGTTANTNYSNLQILQTGGDVVRTGFGKSIFDAVSWEITGGTFVSTSLGHEMNNGSVLTIDGGAGSYASLTVRSGTVNVVSGSLTTSKNINSQGGAVFNFSGGTINVGQDAMLGFQPTTTYNFFGTVDFNVTRNFGEIDQGVRTVTLGAGSGSVDIGGNFEVDGATIDWTSGSGFTITAATLLDNGAATTWESLWTAGQLTVDGSNSGTFAENFLLSGNTLSLSIVPEPSTYALLAGMLGLCSVMLRRRQS